MQEFLDRTAKPKKKRAASSKAAATAEAVSV
jgi:hypothetical protein